MKSLRNLIIFIAVSGLIMFVSSCTDPDTTAPTIYFTQSQDTTVLLLTPFTDPGVYVEDNKDLNAEIEVESDFEDAITLNLDGELRIAGTYEITYTAKDLAGNESEDIRTVNVKNVAEIIAGSYDVNAVYENIADTNFTSSISADSRSAGKVRFTKSYYHSVGGEKIYLKVDAWLYSPDHSLDITNSGIEVDPYYGWMCTPDNPDEPFFYNMDYQTAMEVMPRYTYLHIPYQEFEDTAGNEIEYQIIGKRNNDSGLPESRITYVGDQVTEVTLKINVTRGGVTDRITETYLPR